MYGLTVKQNYGCEKMIAKALNFLLKILKNILL